MPLLCDVIAMGSIAMSEVVILYVTLLCLCLVLCATVRVVFIVRTVPAITIVVGIV